MNVPMIVLGFLERKGPLHGYRLKQLIAEQISDVARIKLPTIYYHLEQLQRKGCATSRKQISGRRPDRLVYTITDRGRRRFRKLLADALNFRYTAEFELDAALFFGENLDAHSLRRTLEQHENFLKMALKKLKARREQALAEATDGRLQPLRAIFSHQLVHYHAELRWVRAVRLELDKPGRYTE